MGVMIYSFNLNISPKMSYGVLECDIVVTELHAYYFVIKKGCYLCWTVCVCEGGEWYYCIYCMCVNIHTHTYYRCLYIHMRTHKYV